MVARGTDKASIIYRVCYIPVRTVAEHGTLTDASVKTSGYLNINTMCYHVKPLEMATGCETEVPGEWSVLVIRHSKGPG